jgi:hypothetical protein
VEVRDYLTAVQQEKFVHQNVFGLFHTNSILFYFWEY